jgi:methylated-DNA-protein-cysteine methyltransferase related protein
MSAPRALPAAKTPRFHRLVYQLVRRVPRGKVVTYGQVAAILGQPRAARAVGQALRMLPRPLAEVVPWQRVINASGRISFRGDVMRPELQRDRLEREGIEFSRGGSINLRRFLWQGPKKEWVTRLKSEM